MEIILGCFLFFRAIDRSVQWRWSLALSPIARARHLTSTRRASNCRRAGLHLKSNVPSFVPQARTGRQGHRLHTLAMLIYENLWNARWICDAMMVKRSLLNDKTCWMEFDGNHGILISRELPRLSREMSKIHADTFRAFVCRLARCSEKASRDFNITYVTLFYSLILFCANAQCT